MVPRKGWRRGRDSNPRYPSGYTPLAGERLRPLGHLSVEWSVTPAWPGNQPEFRRQLVIDCQRCRAGTSFRHPMLRLGTFMEGDSACFMLLRVRLAAISKCCQMPGCLFRRSGRFRLPQWPPRERLLDGRQHGCATRGVGNPAGGRPITQSSSEHQAP